MVGLVAMVVSMVEEVEDMGLVLMAASQVAVVEDILRLVVHMVEAEEDMVLEVIAKTMESLEAVVEEMVVMEETVFVYFNIISKGLMKMNHNYKQTYLSLCFAPPPCKPVREVISEEGVNHAPSFIRKVHFNG